MLLNSFKHALSFSKSGKVLLEEFMDGVEISVEAFVQNNEIVILSLSDKIRTPFPYPLDTHVIFPSNKSKKIQNEAIEIAKAAIKASGLNNSIIHMELMVTNFGVKVVEMAARGELSLIDQLGAFYAPAGAALRATFIVDPSNIIQHVTVNNLNVGRSPEETLRILDALQTGELCACNRTVGGETL